MMQHARLPRQRPRRSARAAPDGFVVGEQSLFDIIDELPPLFILYGQEHPRVTIAPDWQHLMRMYAQGILRVMTARYNGALIGFAFSVVGPTIMTRTTLQGITVAIWLDPAYRQGRNGYNLLKANRDMLLSIGCKRLFVSADVAHQRQAVLYRRLGYKFEEASYAYDSR